MDIEKHDGEIEAADAESGIIASNEKQGVEDILYLAENVERVVAAQNKIRMTLLKLAQSGDWIVFGNDDKAKANLGFAGAMRVGSTLGVNFTNWSAEKESGTDEKGEWYRWNFECDAAYKNRVVRVYGRAGSRDKFFGKAYGEFKPLHDIDEGNIKMAARRGAMKEGVKVLFGLHQQNPDELKKYGVSLEYASGHSFKDSKDQLTEVVDERVQVASASMRQSKPGAPKAWTKYIFRTVEGSEYSTFSESIAKEIKAKGDKPFIIESQAGKYGKEIVSIREADNE